MLAQKSVFSKHAASKFVLQKFPGTYSKEIRASGFPKAYAPGIPSMWHTLKKFVPQGFPTHTYTIKQFVLQARLCILFFGVFSPEVWWQLLSHFPQVFEGFGSRRIPSRSSEKRQKSILPRNPCSRISFMTHALKKLVLQEVFHVANCKEICAPVTTCCVWTWRPQGPRIKKANRIILIKNGMKTG